MSFFNHIKNVFAVILASLVLVACTKTTAMSNGVVLEPVPVEQVQVLFTAPQQPYQELGLVMTQTGQTIFHDRSAEGMIEKMRIKAAEMGADAIIVRTADEGTWGYKGGTTGFDRGKSQAIAIKFNEAK